MLPWVMIETIAMETVLPVAVWGEIPGIDVGAWIQAGAETAEWIRDEADRWRWRGSPSVKFATQFVVDGSPKGGHRLRVEPFVIQDHTPIRDFISVDSVDIALLKTRNHLGVRVQYTGCGVALKRVDTKPTMFSCAFGTKNGLDGEHGFGVETGQLRVDHAKVVPRLTGQMSSALGASGRPIDHTGFVGQTLQDAGRGWPRGFGRTNLLRAREHD